MAADRRLVFAAAITVGFAAGFGVRARLDRPAVLPAPLPASAAIPAPDSSTTKNAFDGVYRDAVWGTNGTDAGTSGRGSTISATLLYRTFLQRFLVDAQITSVVDAGCGDWESTQAVDWSGIDYKGYDIVDDVIAEDRARFERPNVHFYVADIVATELPPADLLIVKQVLQHLPNASIVKFLRQLPKYRHVLIMNGVSPRTLTADNRDIQVGEYRPLDLTAPPFDLVAEKPLIYWDGAAMEQLLHIGRGR